MDDAERRINKIVVSVTDAEEEVIDRLAALRGLGPSTLLRALALESAKNWGMDLTPLASAR